MDKVIEHLIAGCRRRDRNAQLGLYERYVRALYATCLRIVVDPREAEEAMQDAFLKIFTHIEEYSGEASDAFEAWMRQIAVRTAIDHVRREEPEWEELPANWAIADEEEPDEDAVHYSVERVKRAIDNIDGASASVDQPSGTATVRLDRAIDDTVIRKRIEEAGYKVDSIS